MSTSWSTCIILRLDQVTGTRCMPGALAIIRQQQCMWPCWVGNFLQVLFSQHHQSWLLQPPSYCLKMWLTPASTSRGKLPASRFYPQKEALCRYMYEILPVLEVFLSPADISPSCLKICQSLNQDLWHLQWYYILLLYNDCINIQSYQYASGHSTGQVISNCLIFSWLSNTCDFVSAF